MPSTNDHPKCIALAADIPQHLQNRCSFHPKVNNLSTLLLFKLQHWQNINHFPSPPWQLSTHCQEQIVTTVPGITGQVDDIDLKCQYSLTIIASHQADYPIYTDEYSSRGTKTGAQYQLSLEDPQSILKWLQTSKSKEECSPAPTRRKQLPWKKLYAGNPPMPIILQSLHSFAQIANHFVKPSFHQILVPLQVTIPLTPSCLPSSLNGSLAILPFQITN